MSTDARGNAQRIWTPSNVITIIRILLVPVFVAVLLAPWPEWLGFQSFDEGVKRILAAVVFVLISCTDWLDGYLARSRGEVTDFGKFMDPLADKILVCAALVSLVELGSLPTWVVIIILGREFIVSGVRMMAAAKGTVIAASMLGKFKTVFQMIAIVLFTIKDSHTVGGFDSAIGDTLWVVSWITMLIALALTIASMMDYLYKGRALLGFGDYDPEAVSHSKSVEGLLSDNSRVAVEKLRKLGVTLSTAESLTGGLIGSCITSQAGSSEIYAGGIVSYTNDVKHDVLGVTSESLDEFGAVSQRTACEMAEGVRHRLSTDIGVSVTGIAGPGGAEPGKPVGTVWMGISTKNGTIARKYLFEGDRDSVRKQTANAALEHVVELLESDFS